MEKKTVEEHISELRRRVILVIVFFGALSVMGFFISDIVIGKISSFFLSSNVKLIATQPMDYLYAKMNVGLLIGAALSFPVIIYHVFAFIKPGLLEHEKRLALYIIMGSLFLFICGVAFSYFVLLKFTIWFLAGLSYSAGITNLWNINSFMSFVFLFCMTGGIVFQLPLATHILLRLELVTVEGLKKARAYVIVLAFLVAGMITPTVDPFCQMLVAIPIIILYEVSILTGRIFMKN